MGQFGLNPTFCSGYGGTDGVLSAQVMGTVCSGDGGTVCSGDGVLSAQMMGVLSAQVMGDNVMPKPTVCV